jgi:acetolactate decarboxylase
MKKLNVLFLLASIACLAPSLHSQNTPKVFTKGAMKDMGTTYDLKVWLDTLPDKSHVFAMGPYDKMKGEITVVDGKPFHASAFEEGKAVVSQSWDVRSPFFVYSNVKDWEVFDLSGSLTSVQDIQEKVAALAIEKGYDVKEPFAFRIAGEIDKMTLHIVTPRNPEVEGYKPDIKSQKFDLKNADGQLIGFYSENHQGIFTGSKSFVHVHFLKDDQTMMGHVDKILTGEKTLKLYLPKKQYPIKTEIKVNDTDFSKGRLGNIQTIDLDDLVKFHGHLCDGLVVGHLALQRALQELYPEGTIDRTNTRIVSKPSPCLTDVAIYTTGARYQFNTFYVSDALDGLFTVQRLDTGKAVSVKMNNGVKPNEINTLGAKAVKGELSPCDLEKLKQLEDDFSEKLLSTDPEANFTITDVTDFEWNPELKNDYIKTDILNKDKPKCGE